VIRARPRKETPQLDIATRRTVLVPQALPLAPTVRFFQETVLLNATVGMQRVIARLRTGSDRRSSAAVNLQRQSVSLVRAIRANRAAGRPVLSGERLVSVTAVGLVALALAVSNLTTDAASGPTGGTSGAGTEPRIALGGAVSGFVGAAQGGIDDRGASTTTGDTTGAGTADTTGDMALGASLPTASGLSPNDRVAIDGPFRDDGTLLKPIAVDTTVADGKDLLRTYKVQFTVTR